MKSELIKAMKKDHEKTAFFLLLLVMAVYYGYRMFALTPWYDELYTYYYFISRGPVYAAIHWPLPNNHVGYSVLSGFLNYLGNPYIGLRGVSYVCALVNLWLIFMIGRRFFSKWLSFTAVLLYLSMNLVNQLAVQGRGYTLGITCYLLSFYYLIQICSAEKVKRRAYVLFSFSLVLGLYTLISDVYWVIPVCLAGGIYLLYRCFQEKGNENEKKRLVKLIMASLAAAVMTIFLYAVIWLAIGSNLLVKDAAGSYFGMSHAAVILKAPFQALGTGMDYMLATPYIQSVEREGFPGRLFEWFLSLFHSYYDSGAQIILLIAVTGFAFLTVRVIKGMKQNEKSSLLLPVFLMTGMICIPLFLLIQCKLPYYRVFAYGGVLLAFLFAFLLQELLKMLFHAQKKQFITGGITVAVITVFAFCQVCFGSYNDQYGMREFYIQDAWEQAGITENETISVTDCTQQYLLHFLYGIRCENTQIEGVDVVLLDKRMTDPDYSEMEWEFYHYFNTIPWDYIDREMKVIYENSDFILFKKK